MIIIKKLWSEDKSFKTVEFKPGINFIVGDSSRDKSGNINNEQRNGSGKSLTIELINFALLKKRTESRISKIPDAILPPESFVFINLTINNSDVTIGRNKLGTIKIKVGEGGFIEQEELVAKKELAKICGFEKQISFRDFCNFVVKESGYNYSNFLYFFVSNAISRLKTSLYFFDLPIELFEEIADKQNEFDGLNSIRMLSKKKVENKGLDIHKLRSLKTDLEFKIKEIQEGLSYEEISKNVSDSSFQLQKEELEFSDFLREKGKIEFSISEIEEFIDHTNDDVLINDTTLKNFFNNYISGLGDFVQKDFSQLMKFRDSMSIFKIEMMSGQKESLRKKLDEINSQIVSRQENILKFRAIIDIGKNHLQRGMIMSNKLVNDFNEYSKLLDDIDYCDKNIAEVTSDFQSTYSDLSSKLFLAEKKENSFRKTFLDIHEKVYGNKEGIFDFNLSEKRNIRDKEFFKIKVEVDRQGSEGRNRGRQILYDLSIITNEYTRERSHNLLIHDRLLFGDIDNDATFNILNYLGSLNQETFQYIGTFNTDVMSVESASKNLNFDVKQKEAIKLTIKDPIFFKQFKQNGSSDEKEIESDEEN